MRLSHAARCVPLASKLQRLLITHSRVSFCIEEVGQQIHEYKHDAEEEYGTLNCGEIAPGNCIDYVSPHSRPAENRLGKNASGKVGSEVEAEDGNDRDKRVAQRVASDHGS